MAFEFYVTIEGMKQGKFKGESQRETHKDAIPASGFVYEVLTVRDTTSGRTVGKREHHPILMTKEWGAATPQIHQALITNEILKSVTCQFVRTNRDGGEEVFQMVKLTNARVTAIKDYIQPPQVPSAASGPYLEDVSFVFEKIEIENLPGQTICEDTW